MLNHRFERVQEEMEKRGLRQILVTSTAAVYYLTGVWVDPLERLLALYLDTDGRRILFGNHLFGLTQLPGTQLELHVDGEDPVAGIAQTAHTGTLGIDESWPSRFLIGLMDARRDIHPVLGSAPVQEVRMVKDAEELSALRRASRINDSVVEEAIAYVRAGMPESELEALIAGKYRAHGADDIGFQMASFGENSADPHHHSNTTALGEGQTVLFDIGASFNRYFCDMTRTVFCGSVSDEQRRVYETVLQANLAGIAAIRPGEPLAQFDLAARRVIENAGYGKYFTHRLGHGIGIECHEAPYVTSVNALAAREGMVFSVEPGIYLPGKFGVRIEDLVVVTKDGCEVLNQVPKELRVIEV